jgi:hypothetical protein
MYRKPAGWALLIACMVTLSGCGDEVPVIDTVYIEEVGNLMIEGAGAATVEITEEFEAQEDLYIAEALDESEEEYSRTASDQKSFSRSKESRKVK